MNDQFATRVASNPFSTKFIRPGAIDFVFDRSEDLFSVSAAFERSGRIGQIVGPHGSGKSTLLWALRPLLEATADLHWTQVPPKIGRRLLTFKGLAGGLEWPRPKSSWNVRSIGVARPVRRGESMGVVESTGAAATPFSKPQGVPPEPSKPRVWVIDGFDRLSWIVRLAIRRLCRQKQLGLLVTTHRDLNLPTLYRPCLTFASFRSLVRELQSHSGETLDEDMIRSAYERHFPNVREALFTLYDCYEQQRREE